MDINSLFNVKYEPKYRFKSFDELLNTKNVRIYLKPHSQADGYIVVSLNGHIGYAIREHLLEADLQYCNELQYCTQHFIDTCCVLKA